MSCTKGTFNTNEGKRRVTYQHDDGRTVVHEGGSRSWRNNNPGNVRGAVNRRVGTDAKGFDIYPDVQTGQESCRRMFEPGKVAEYDRNGRQIEKPLSGSKSIEDFEEDYYADPGFTMSP